jgi:hypothetical protein
VFALIAGADLLISNITSDELSNMGIERKSWSMILIQPPSPMLFSQRRVFWFNEETAGDQNQTKVEMEARHLLRKV